MTTSVVTFQHKSWNTAAKTTLLHWDLNVWILFLLMGFFHTRSNRSHCFQIHQKSAISSETMRRACIHWFAKLTALLCFHISQVLYWEAIFKQVQFSQKQPSVLVLSWPATICGQPVHSGTCIYQSSTPRLAIYHYFVHTYIHVLIIQQA